MIKLLVLLLYELKNLEKFLFYFLYFDFEEKYIYIIFSLTIYFSFIDMKQKNLSRNHKNEIF